MIHVYYFYRYMTAMSRPSHSDVIIVSDGGRSAVKAFNLDGVSLWTYCGGTAVPRDFLEGSTANPKRKLSNTAGDYRSWPSGSDDCRNYPPETVDPSFKPAGLSIDHQGRVLLADCGSGRVSVLTSIGYFEKCLLGEKDGVRTPRSVSVDNHGLMVVVDLSSFRLYQLENRAPNL